MKKTRILSWNVNGLRAVHRKGFLDWLLKEQPDILCVQETKAQEEQLPLELREFPGYNVYFSSAERKGYSGVGLFTKEKPERVSRELGIPKFDCEGRTLIAEYDDFILFNVYFPNGKASPERLAYKMEFYDAFLEHVDKLKNQGKNLLICGDVNTAHKEIDLARPKENEMISGFLPEERAWMDKFISHGYLDTFRIFVGAGGHYSWWSFRTRARVRNVGWRLDYFFVSQEFKDAVKSAFILTEVMGSDHCPVGVELGE